MKREWWCHTPSGYWFIAERDTARDEFLATYDAAELPARAARMMYRLPPVAGEWIDRSTAHRFEFEGRAVPGFRGRHDLLARSPRRA